MNLSVIIPVYNASDFFETTLKAVLSQTQKPNEIIIVDDGSTDESYATCLKYQILYPELIYINTHNHGPGYARNIGIAIASSEWIAFCDSDDIPDASMYELMSREIINTNTDFCACSYFSDRDNREEGFPWRENSFEGVAVIENYMASMIGNNDDKNDGQPLWGCCWRGLYNAKIIHDNRILFPEDIRFAEDLVFNLRYLVCCKSISIIHTPLYHYRCNPTSLMISSTSGYTRRMFVSRRILVTYIEEVINKVPLSQRNDLLRRLRVTERSYYSECVGNAFTKAGYRTTSEMLSEARQIIYDEKTQEVFKSFRISTLKKTLLYFAIKYKLIGILFIYYRMRLGDK